MYIEDDIIIFYVQPIFFWYHYIIWLQYYGTSFIYNFFFVENLGILHHILTRFFFPFIRRTKVGLNLRVSEEKKLK